MKSTLMKLLTLMCILSFTLASCTSKATPTATSAPAVVAATATSAPVVVAATTTTAPAAPTATTAPAATATTNPMDYLNSARADQVIVDNPYQLTYPDNGILTY